MTATQALPAPSPGDTADRSLWQHRDFLRLWGGQTVSLFGSRITELALPLTAMLVLNATTFQLGLLTAVEFLPVALFTLPAGVAADRLRRRPLLIACNLGRAALLATVPVLAWTHHLSMALLCLAAFSTGVLTAQFDVAYQAFLPQVVDRSRLVEANSKLQATRSIAELTGQGVSGVLIQLLTAPVAVLVDCASYLVSATLLAAMRTAEPATDRATPHALVRAPIRTQIAEGMRAIFGNRALRLVMIQSSWFNCLWAVVVVVFPVHCVRGLGINPGLVGGILCTGGFGALLGAMAARRMAARLGVGRTLGLAMLVACGCLLLLPLAAGNRLELAAQFVLAYTANGAAMAVFNIHSVALRQQIVAADLIGRASAAYRFVTFAVIPFGGLLAGLLARYLGARGAILAAVLAMLAGAAPFALARALRTPAPTAD